MIKAISIRQPWAWLIVNGWKEIEYRTWRTNYRGPLAIHAGLKIDKDEMADIEKHFRDIEKCAPPENLYWIGGIVGQVDLIDCIYSPAHKDYEWILTNPQPCELIPMLGKLHLFDVNI